MISIIRSDNLLYQPFLLQVKNGLSILQNQGVNVYLFETWRTPERQDHLYNQTPKVTNAKAWESWHQYGVAADLAFGGPGKWSWKGDVEKVRKVMIEAGLKDIGMKDPLHFELNHSFSLKNARDIVENGSILSFWYELDKSLRKEIH